MRRISFFGNMDPYFSGPFHDHLCKMPNVELVRENADLAVVASYGKLFPSKVINSFPLGMINMHPSLLPKYRGAAPAEWQILKGEHVGGISVMKIVPKMDSGPVLCQKAFDISDLTRNELLKRASSEGIPLLNGLINEWKFDHEIEQDESAATYAPKVARELTRIDWKSWKKEDFMIRMRAFKERYGGLETTYKDRKLKICELEYSPFGEMENEENGTIMFDHKKRQVFVKIVDGWMKCVRFQFENRNTSISADDLQRGYLHKHKENKFI